MKSHKNRYNLRYFCFLLVILSFFQNKCIAQNELQSKPKKEKSFKMTTLVFGGTGVLFSKVNNQFTVMNGGRGAAVFNKRYTIGGGGWGMPKGVEIQNNRTDTFSFAKLGYGGIELGYILYPGKKFVLGTNALFAGGAVFKETVPKTKNAGFKMFPVIEPSLYGQLSLGKLFKLNIGVNYRFITGANASFISDKNMSGFACYFALLVGTCKCD